MKTFAKIAALVFGVVVVVLTLVVVIWVATRPGYEAVALLKVSSVTPMIAFDVDVGGEEVDCDIYRLTQIASATGSCVLQAALRKNGIARLPMLAEQDDPVRWLQANLDISFPYNGEIMAIALRGNHPEVLEQIVDAVNDAYLEEVVYKERKDKQITFDQLQRIYQATCEQLRQESEKFLRLANALGNAHSKDTSINRTLAFRELERLHTRSNDVQNQLCEAVLAMKLNAIRRKQMGEQRTDEGAAQTPVREVGLSSDDDGAFDRKLALEGDEQPESTSENDEDTEADSGDDTAEGLDN